MGLLKHGKAMTYTDSIEHMFVAQEKVNDISLPRDRPGF